MSKAKPEPPSDLWSQLEEHLAAVAAIPPRPANSFTREQFKERFKLNESASYKRLQAMQRAGTIKRFGTGRLCYYMLTSDLKSQSATSK